VEPGRDDDLTPPPSRRTPLTVIVAAVLIVSLIASGIVIAVDTTSRDDDRIIRVDDSFGDDDLDAVSIPDGPPPSEDELATIVKELSAFVADARGREYKQVVPVKLLDDAAFSKRVQDDAVQDVAELEDTEDLLKAIGLLDDDVHLADLLSSFLGGAVVGFYDPKTDELVVRGASITPYVRTTLVHELTHALDDQWFELDRPALDDADDESGLGFSSLVEGNAVRIEEQYRKTMSKSERRAADAEEARLSAGLDLSRMPRVIPELIGFPYSFGPPLVAALAKDGEARVDEAFEHPPLTSEQVVDPERWLAGKAEPVTVPPPKADGEVFDQGVLGLWGIVILLEDEVGTQNAYTAAQGWGGDWYVAWREGARTCVRTTIVMDTPDDLKDLESMLEDWAAAQDDADVSRGDGQVTFRSCA
jgi:hypothetical protein